MKDISQYIDFKKGGDGRYPKRSLRSLCNLPCIVHEWQVLESKFKPRENSTGLFAQIHVELDAGHFIVNTSSKVIQEQLAKVAEAKKKAGETEMGFTCMVKRTGSVLRMMPMDWGRKDVSAIERTQGEQDGSADKGV